MLIAPLPYPEGDRLVMVWEDVPRWDIARSTPAPANLLDWRAQNQALEGMAAFMGGIFGDVALTGAGMPNRSTEPRSLPIFFEYCASTQCSGATSKRTPINPV